MRLDLELVKRGLFETRNKAQNEIKANQIEVNNKIISKPGFEVDENDEIKIVGEVMPYVSRGGYKLEKAIKEFNLILDKKVMLDIGSSTGGFSDCALQNNINKIIAIDVGSNQMDKKISSNEKVELYENTDFRTMDINILKKANFATIDVSFISVEKINERFSELENLLEIVCLIKPQFECGKEIANKYKGIINDKQVHYNVIKNIIKSFENQNYILKDITTSPIKGGSGNIEYLAYFIRNKNENNNKNEIQIDEKIKNMINDNFKKIND